MDDAELKRIASEVTAMLQQRTATAPQTPVPVGSFSPVQPVMVPAAAMGMPNIPTPTGLLLRIKVQLPDGSAALGYLSFGPEVLQNPAALPGVVQQLAMAWPIDFYAPRNNWAGNGGGSWNGRRGCGGRGW